MIHRALLLLALASCAAEPPALAPPASASIPAAPLAPPAPPAAAPLRYLALGDSFTAGTGSRPEDAFPVRLAERLRARGTPVTLENLGVNGYTTDDLITHELPRLAPFAPTLVTLAIGANDLVHGSPLGRYRAQVHRILAAIVAAGVPADRIFVLPQPDWSRSPVAAGFGDPRAIAAQIEASNEALRAEATAAGARWVDIFPRMRRQAEAGMIADDGLHPAARAYDEWAEELAGQIVPSIASWLGSR